MDESSSEKKSSSNSPSSIENFDENAATIVLTPRSEKAC